MSRVAAYLTNVAALGGAPAYVFTNTEASDLVARMSSQPDSTRKGLIDDLVGDLKAAGIWTELDVLYVLAAHDAQAARLNWVSSSFDATAVNTPTFTADQGYAGNGSTSYLSSGYAPATNGVNYIQNDGSLWVWSRTDGQLGTAEIGSTSGEASGAYLSIRQSGDRSGVQINEATGGLTASSTVTDARGLFSIQRTASNATKNTRNGVSYSTASGVSNGVPAQIIRVGGRHNTQFSTRQLAVAAVGASLNGLEADFYNALNTYLTAVGAA